MERLRAVVRCVALRGPCAALGAEAARQAGSFTLAVARDAAGEGAAPPDPATLRLVVELEALKVQHRDAKEVAELLQSELQLRRTQEAESNKAATMSSTDASPITRLPKAPRPAKPSKPQLAPSVRARLATLR